MAASMHGAHLGSSSIARGELVCSLEVREEEWMLVKSKDRKKRRFKGVDLLVGATGERMMVTLMTFEEGQEVGRHSHPHEQVGYCVQGRFELTVDGQPMLIEPDDSYAIPGDVPHSYRILEDSLAVEVFSPPRKDYM